MATRGVARAGRLSLLPRPGAPRRVDGIDPSVGAGEAHGRGDAAGRADRRCDELRDVGAGPAAACLRHAAAGRPRDRRPPSRARRASRHPGRRGAGAHRGGPPDLRPGEAGRDRRHHGRADVRGLRHDDRRPPRERLLHEDRDHQDRAPPRAALGGFAPLRARHRPGGRGAGRPPGRGADRRVDGCPGAHRRRAGGRPARASPRLDARFPRHRAPRLPGHPVRCRGRVRRPPHDPSGDRRTSSRSRSPATGSTSNGRWT